MSYEHLKVESSKIGDALGGVLSSVFTPEFLQGLISSLIGKLFQCDPPKDGATLKQRVQSHYQGNGRYRRVFFSRIARSVRQIAEQEGTPMSDGESQVVAKEFLDHIRKEEASTLNLVIQELRTT